ncbi:dolichyl pyrophosphate Man9GlcNAc2 alpha-1,3-glucosyltransferase [Paenibacillus sp. RC67]|uniref:dolichyl pyrophosphate Man9GlcNAc2 alpha-1,3-glucosyltransferase n=1 Tax=Paenibacillus sp. RC67 TaxID=3039392 RepID=UPI0024ACA555|nr:dolichyl pyrophosphate Man9GlcNAc2 alpha-1,3-glucosyltransferase [Paenibacillus sp. RC67]
MSLLKNHKTSAALLLILLLSIGTCVYSLWSYGNTSAAGTSSWQQGSPQGGFGQQRGSFATGKENVHEGQSSTPSSDNRRSTAERQQPPAANSGTIDGSLDHIGNTGSGRGMPGQGGGRFGGPAMGGSSTSSKYAVPLAGYAVLFFGAAAAALYLTRRGRGTLQLQEREQRIWVWSILGTGLFLRIAAAPWIPGHMDLNLFKSWATSAAKSLPGFYLNGSSDYPPFYVYILYVTGKLAANPALSPYYSLLLKLPSMAADAATAYLLYRAARKFVSFEIILLIAALYIGNPAIFINSTFWGQVDSFFTLLVVGSLMLLYSKKIGWATVLLTVSVLMKPQGIIYLPVLFFELVRMRQVKPWLIAAGSAILTVLVVIIPFSLGQDPSWLLKLYTGTVNEYPYASVNAYNLFALLGANYTKDTVTLFLFDYHTWGMAFIVAITLFSWWMYAKCGNVRFAAAAALIQIAGVFTFSTSMHERYLFPAAALALLAFAYLQDRRLLWLSIGFSLTIFMNTYDILYHSSFGGGSYSITLFVTSILNILLCGWLAKIAWDYAKGKKPIPDMPAIQHPQLHDKPLHILDK